MSVGLRRTRQALRLLAGLVRSRLTGRPLLLSHLVTCRCPCRCETCLWRGLVDEEMSAAEIAEVYRQAAKVGIVINSIWGGEPAVREDLPAVLRASRETGMITTMITSGLGFGRRADELLRWLDGVIFSLDYPSTRHDEMRGVPGLFDAVTEAVDQISRQAGGTRVYVNAAISRLNQDAAPELARWARFHQVPVYFNPIEVGLLGKPDSETAKESLAIDGPVLSELFRELISLKGRGYPIANSYTHLRSFIGGKRRYRCHVRKCCLELRPNGDLIDCLNRFRPVANVKEVRLADWLSRPDVRRRRLRDVRCNVCNNADVIDTSHVWELRPESVFSLVRPYLVPPGR